jgi:hypothetical protein
MKADIPPIVIAPEPGGLAGPPRKPFLFKKLLGRIVTGLACSAAVTAMMNLLYIKSAIAFGCALVLWLLGWETKPPTGEPKPEFAVRVEREAKKATDHLKKLQKEESEPPQLKLPTPAVIAAERGKVVAGTVEQGAAKIGDKIDNAAEKVTDKFTLLRDEIEHKRAEAEKAEKESLLIRARELGLQGEAWPLEKLRAEVHRIESRKEEEKREVFLEWWAKVGPNGRCPACHHPMRVSLRGDGRVACPSFNCELNSSSSQVRRQGAPPPPRQYPPEFLRWYKRR